MEANAIRRVVFLSLLMFRPFLVGAQTSPDQFLGFELGADRKLADYEQIRAYFARLDAESEGLELFDIGQTTLGKPIIMAAISSPAVIARLDTYRDMVRRLRDPRTLGPEEARRLAGEGKVILFITCNVHATEIGSSQAAMELAYRLITGHAAQSVLDDVIVLLVPSINPDGQQMVTDWYEKYLGTEYEGGRMPWLYHHYAGHDTARDSFMLNLSETRAFARVMFHDWLPQIHLDQHQMGSTGARLFLPPYIDPPYPTIHPHLLRSIALTGAGMAYDLSRQGFRGIVHGRMFPAWLFGNLSDTSWLHGVVSLLSEMASVNVASPIVIEPNEISDAYTEMRMDFPDPWPGGRWALRDIIDYEVALSLSLIRMCSLYKEDFLFSFYRMYRDQVELRAEDEPFAFVVPADQHDRGTALRMVEILLRAGVEVHRARRPFTADGRVFAAGSFVIMMSQPYRPYARAVLERQRYPDIRQYPGGPPVPPYDSAGMTLPLQMGVSWEPIAEPFQAELDELVEPPRPEPASFPEEAFLVLDARENHSYTAAFSLLSEGATVFRSRSEIRRDGIDVAAGSFVVENGPRFGEALRRLSTERYLRVAGLDDIEGIERDPVTLPRIGLYQSWLANMAEGWVRYFLDDFHIPFQTLRNDDFSAGGSLSASYDVIVFADEDPTAIKNGSSARSRNPLPPEYRGGIGDAGIAALKTFVAEGGILVTLNGACGLAFDELGVPARNAVEGVDRDTFFCPASLLRLSVDNQSPIGYGMPAEAAAVFSRSVVMETFVPGGGWDRHVVAAFPEKDLLLSGWLLGEQVIARKAAVVDVGYGKGRVILIGIRSQNRAQSHGTYKFLLNAFLYPRR